MQQRVPFDPDSGELPCQAEGDAALAGRLREAIASGEFMKNGRLLPERELAALLGVTRARLRRALDLMEREGRVFRRRGQGTFAAPPPAPDLGRLRHLASKVMPNDVMEVRLEIEPALAALAARRATGEEIRLLQQLMKSSLRVSDMAAYETADDIFHFKIAEMAHNPLFLTVYEAIRDVRKQAAWTRRRRRTYSDKTIARLGTQHEELFTCIADHDPQGAAEVMEAHLLTVSRAMLRERSYDGPQMPEAGDDPRLDGEPG